MATDYPAFTSMSEAIQRARDMVKGDFCISAEGNQGEISDVELLCVQTYNDQWALKAKPLGLQI